MTEQNQEAENWRGILWAMLSVIGASAMAISVRGASLGLDTRLLVGYRLFFTLILIGILILIVPRLRSKVHFKQPRAHLIRGILMAFSVHLGFYTLSIVPLAAAAILFATAPIFATIISVAMGRETIGIRRTLAILVGFIGTIIVMRPSSEIIDTNMIYGIGSSIFFSFSLVMSRNLARTDGPLSTLISTSAIGLIVTIPLAAPVFEITTDTNIITSAMIVDGAIVNADINASAAIADTKLATISTAGKVANTATTATSANTASAIVARDASGNFTAGTITANVTGNVSGSSGSTTGNAATATTLATARDFQIVGDVEASAQSFNGSGNVTLTTSIATKEEEEESDLELDEGVETLGSGMDPESDEDEPTTNLN